MGDDPSISCFTWVNWDEQAFTDGCSSRFGRIPQYDWALDVFGGRDITKDWASTSNIIFSNGDLDPFLSGCVTTNNTSPDNIALVMKDAAHHLDIRLPVADKDPQSVVEGRDIERTWIKKWIKDYSNLITKKESNNIETISQ